MLKEEGLPHTLNLNVWKPPPRVATKHASHILPQIVSVLN
jgi:hypothetical protein